MHFKETAYRQRSQNKISKAVVNLLKNKRGNSPPSALPDDREKLMSTVNVNNDKLTAASMRDGPRVEPVEHGGRPDALNGKKTAARVGVTPSGGTYGADSPSDRSRGGETADVWRRRSATINE